MRPRAVFAKIKRQGRRNLTEFEAREILRDYKIPVAKAELSKDSKEAAAIAKRIGYPVAIKAMSPQIVHKTDAKVVFVDIRDAAELEKAYKQVALNAKRFKRSAKLQGILVQEMVKGGREVIIGGKKDAQFGQVLMFGGGGILTEIMGDVSFRVCPVSRMDAQEMIDETKFSKVLRGYRGKRSDIKSLVELLVKTSRMLEENPEIAELDMNPVMALQKGAVAVDARIVIG